MREDSKQRRENTKVRGMLRKACFAFALSAVCVTGSMQGMIVGSLPVAEAAGISSLSNVKPAFTIQSRTSTTAKIVIETVSQASYYKIYRSTSKDGNFVYVGNAAGSIYKDTGLSAKKSYYYKIKACNASGCSKYSKAIKLGSTLGKVQGVTASYNNGSVTIRYTALAGASRYKVYRSTSKYGSYQYIGSSKQTVFQDSTVNTGRTYYYKIRGVKTATDVTYNGVYSAKVMVACGSTASSESSYIDEVLRLVNIERAKEGLSQLSTNDSLKKAAHQRAIEIKSVFSHNRPDGSSCFTALGEFNVSYQAAGENIAYGQKSPAEVVEGWMNSEGHRANILSSKFGKIGIGCYESNGTLYWTQLFTN